ncbi:protein-L-isoaspartate(D-aspartate) O-methyltransferase [Roseomonas hellenica]|uniref:Protein-L-isoaspartate O-methyltransferase n=1 Tax=Plastoroseomonas hellenica TaxID=2687306 RepID=A0ABS5EWK2_9PROT|nr:protein-L-isoaspartate(D-aspartate) O-methyltransferase [Plastoroseomonas hellenica]MBR0664687.1 protein-L-isoaspartate(D-aspartate) O-methyltransferase [Plastoroseomonas hellenica]
MKPLTDKHLSILRRHMVELISVHADLLEVEIGKPSLDDRVLAAMQRVPRHLFVPPSLATHAYQDSALPIGFDKTISQPFICALMTDLLKPSDVDVVLEIGTGLGYQTAILAELTSWVWTVEIVEEFSSRAEALLNQLGYSNVGCRVGDGSRGWIEHGPYDKILLAAAPEQVPPHLVEQLKPGGRMVLPVGPADDQRLTVINKDMVGEIHARQVIPVKFGSLETII